MVGSLLAGCGGGIPGDAVVQVNGTPITKTTFNHWMAVTASSSTSGTGAKPVIPEPPSYTACIAHLKTIEPKAAKGHKPKTEALLKTQCEQQYQAEQQQVLGFLIGADWVLGQAEEDRIKLSDKEVAKKFNELKKQQYPDGAEFQKFLATTGQSVADLLLRVKLNLLSSKIQEKVTEEAKKNVNEAAVAKYYNEHKSTYATPAKRGKPGSEQSLAQVRSTIEQQLASTQQETALTAFVKEYEQRWKGRTECRVGYVMQRCKQYKTPTTTPSTPVSTPAG